MLRAFLAASLPTIIAYAMPIQENIPQETDVQILQLPNGVKSYVRQHASGGSSVKVIVRTSAYEHVQYAYDLSEGAEQEIEAFFAYCNENILGQKTPTTSLDLCRYSKTSMTDTVLEGLQDVAVVAVGNFEATEMQKCIEKNFSHLALKTKTAPAIEIDYSPSLSKVALRFFYHNEGNAIHTYSDLEESWKYFLLQDLLQQRLEHCCRILGETWLHPYPRFCYPIQGYAIASEEISENLLALWLWQIEKIRTEGFSPEEFYVVKRNLLNRLQYLDSVSTQPDASFLSSYYADQFLLGDQCLSHPHFLTASLDLVNDLSLEDVESDLTSFLDDHNRHIELTYPINTPNTPLTLNGVEDLMQHITSLADFYRDSEAEEDEWDYQISDTYPISSRGVGYIRNEDTFNFSLVNDGSSFYSLPLSEEEKRLIRIIVSTMADKNVVQLVFKRQDLEKKGKKINHVHPLRFMGYILSNPELKSHVKEIKKSSFKWDAFIDGFAKRMKEELSRNNVYQHVQGFAGHIGANPDQITHYIQKKDFEGLVKSQL